MQKLAKKLRSEDHNIGLMLVHLNKQMDKLKVRSAQRLGENKSSVRLFGVLGVHSFFRRLCRM